MYYHKKRMQTMSMMITIVVIMLITLLLPTNSAKAFDGNRNGFILGGGIGPGYAKVEYNYSRRGDAETIGVQSLFILGAGVNDNITLSYTGLQFWGNGDNREVGFALIPSFGVRYFFSPEAPSPFGCAGLGFAVYDDDSYDWSIGGGFSPHLGFGYEFSRHYSVEIDVLYTSAVYESHKPLLNVMILFTAIAY